MSGMRGLAVFISDLRSARARESEEKRVNTELAKIRAKFRDTKLSGYDRKKYVCKLLYMYILGWNIAFGHLETVALISSNKYSEKQIGYLGVTLFLNEHHELLHLVVNSLKKDLLHTNELFNCLALHCIANVGGREMGAALAADVHQLLVSGTSRPFVKKKAALTLLRLYRRTPDIIENSWAPRIISLIDDMDLGVTLSVTSFLTVLAQDQPETYADSYQRAVHRLKFIVIDTVVDVDNKYYNVPCPWLQIKLMKLLLLYPPTADPLLRTMLSDVLTQILDSGEIVTKNVQQNNAHNAILFQAIDLAMHIEPNEHLTSQVMSLLTHFLKSKETNVRYLGLEIMVRLSGRSELLSTLRGQQSTISHSLKDRDLSVRRRALDLLYSLCHSSNAKETIMELLRYLQISDYSIKEELVLKIAILVEKFATEYDWYLTITLQLLAMAGNQVADQVWQRVVQVVANNEGLQEHAARSVLAYLRAPNCHENLVKVGGLILGEFGHLIANEDACSPIDQFSVIHSCFNVSSNPTRAILLSTYIKYLNVFPEIAAELTLVFRQLEDVLDAELQQRACEYSAISELPEDDLLQAMCEEMPPYPKSITKLILKPYSREHEHGPVDAGVKSASGQTVMMPSDYRNSRPDEALNHKVHLSPGWQIGYERLSWKDHGVLYEDAQLRILLKSEYAGPTGRMVLTFDNKSPTNYSAFTTRISPNRGRSFSIRPINLVETIMPSRTQNHQTFEYECDAVSDESPIFIVNYYAGSLQELILKLPIHLGKFMVPATDMDTEMFGSKWRHLDAVSLEAKCLIKVTSDPSTNMPPKLLKILQGHRWGLLPGMDMNKYLCGAALLEMYGNKRIGCLLRLEPLQARGEYELVIRTSLVGVADVLIKVLASNIPPSLAS